MTNANTARRAHDVVDGLSAGRILSQENEQLLRSFLPELPAQKTLEEITDDVYKAWIASSGDEWVRDGITGSVISLEDWLTELHTQLKGIAPAKPAHPEFLETEGDYANAPRGTVAAKDGWNAWLKETDGVWSCGGGSEGESSLAQSGKRRVLRWGWTNERL